MRLSPCSWPFLPLGLLGLAHASTQPAAPATSASPSWQSCQTLSSDSERLVCYDTWAKQQANLPATTRQTQVAATSAPAAPAPNASTAAEPPGSSSASLETPVGVRPCNDPNQSVLSRVWELESATDCGRFVLRGHRPNYIGVTGGNNINRQPSSPSAGHTLAQPRDYQKGELKLQLSLRTKLGSGLLRNSDGARDSLWFAYSQQSHWQVFNGEISRPFRATDHEPELIYILPINHELGAGWNWRYAGLGVVHQSNGQSLPLSRSWNRTYLSTGLEWDKRLTLQARVWKRINESDHKDDNPDMVRYMGRAELAAAWHINERNTVSTLLRSSFGRTHRGSARVEWSRAIGQNTLSGMPGNLRFFVQAFTGYGESLIDYNHKRTSLTVGFSLVDF